VSTSLDGETVARRDPLRRTLVLVSGVICFETVLFSVLAPLLPHLADRFGLSKSAAGVLVASYAAGALLGAVPSGLLATRIGAKATALCGLLVLGLASIAFGLAPDATTLFLARLAQGVGCSLAWTGGFAWLVGQAPREKRGEVIGVALAAAVAGSLLGPVLGAVASSIGTTGVFVALAVPSFVLTFWGAGLPGGPVEESLSLRAFGRALAEPSLLGGSALIALAGFLLGVISLLAPLHLADLGWGAAGIGAVFLLAGAVTTAVNPRLGRWADRAGTLPPLRAALVLSAAGSLALTWSAGRWAYGVLVVVAYVAYEVLWTPPMVLLAHAADKRGIGFSVSFALMNLCWSPGLLLGSAVGGALAQVSSDAVPYALAAGLSLAALAVLEWTRPAEPR
jgi:predicted MFS family arabinose efflux permease